MKKPEQVMGDMARLRRTIDESDFDAVVAVSPENVRYAGDVHIGSQSIIRDRLALIVWASGREPIFIVCQVEEGFVRQESWIEDIRGYKEFVTSPVTMLADTLRELGLSKGRIGLETEYLAAKYYNQLMEEMPGIQAESCEDLFTRVRMYKTPREIEMLTKAYVSTEKALMATYINVQVGETEKSMANRLADNIMHAGADCAHFYHINAGPNTGFPHMPPSSYQVKKNDIVKADCGGLFSEYQSNIGRTAKMGKPNEEDNSYWKRLREIHHKVADMLRPGNTGRQLFEEAARLHEKVDIPFPYAHNGHSIGLQVHEHPIISPHDDIAYEPGMVSTVETRVRWVGKVGYHMEDLYLITEGAPVLLSDYFDNEEILVI
jgi:Xaa-Pro aminopeptidase